jgi:hypothetical protein
LCRRHLVGNFLGFIAPARCRVYNSAQNLKKNKIHCGQKRRGSFSKIQKKYYYLCPFKSQKNIKKFLRTANPVFDSVLKLLVQDLRAAKFLFGSKIAQEVLEIQFCTNDCVKIRANEYAPFLLLFDYSAKIKAEDGSL